MDCPVAAYCSHWDSANSAGLAPPDKQTAPSILKLL